jgi:hypothetical protein
MAIFHRRNKVRASSTPIDRRCAITTRDSHFGTLGATSRVGHSVRAAGCASAAPDAEKRSRDAMHAGPEIVRRGVIAGRRRLARRVGTATSAG